MINLFLLMYADDMVILSETPEGLTKNARLPEQLHARMETKGQCTKN